MSNNNFITEQAGRDNRFRGQAGEYRVLSELLLRGHHPLIPSVDHGYDILLENGLRLQVKTSTRKTILCNKSRSPYEIYQFASFKKRWSGKYDRNTYDFVDYMVLWGIDDDVFYIIPVEGLSGWNIQVWCKDSEDETKYGKYKGAWDLLNVGED